MEKDIYDMARLVQVSRLLKSNSKSSLCILEDLFNDHEEFIEKLIPKLSPEQQELISLLNPLTIERFGRARKKVLDNLGDALRNLDQSN